MDKYVDPYEKPHDKTVIRVQHLEDLPVGAVRLSENEVLEHHFNIIRKWDKPSQIWPFRYGMGIVSGAAAISGIIINAHFRKKFKLWNFGRVASYLPAVFLPAMISAICHQVLVINPILVGDYSCTMCIETRSGALAAGIGAVYPLVISPISCIILARRYYTVPIPNITEGARLFGLFRKTSPTVGGFVLIVGQFFLGMYLAEREITTFQNLIAKSPRDLNRDNEVL